MKKEMTIKYEKIYKHVPEIYELSASVNGVNDFHDKNWDVIFDTGRFVFAPVLNSFVAYVLKDAINKGIKTLYFLARDAYFYYKIAEKYVEKLDLEIQCKYLYVSRLSLRVPLYHLDIDKALSYITLGGVDVTPCKVINRAGLGREESGRFAIKIADYLGIAIDEQIPRHRLEDVRRVLMQDEAFIKLLIENSKKEFSNAVSYLEEMGFGAKEKIAIVDSGWVGSIQQSLNDFRRHFGIDKPIEGYYFGLYETPIGVKERYYHTYLFNPISRLREKVYFNNCLFECIFSAPHGMTLRYRKQSDRYEPVLSSTNPKYVEYLHEIECIINAYQEKLFKKYSFFEEIYMFYNEAISKKAIEHALFSFMSKPSKREAEVFGKLHFSDDVIDYDDAVLAKKLTESDLRDNHFLSRVFIELREIFFRQRYVVNISGWYEGSVMLYSKPAKVSYHLMAYNHYKYYLQYSKRKKWIRERSKNEKTHN